MFEMKITDEMIFDFLTRAENLRNTESDIELGWGSERVALIYNDFLTLKIPCWREVKDDELNKFLNSYKYSNNNTLFQYNNRNFYIYGESQTSDELDMTKIIPMNIVRKFGAEIIAWGTWKDHFITLNERLIPDNYGQLCEIEDEVQELLEQMEQELKDYPIKICDLHAQNFAKTKEGKVKFCDLGYWAKSDYGFGIDWENFERNLDENSNGTYSDYSNSGE